MVPPRKISRFINEAVICKLEEKQNELYQAYLEASQDSEREEELKEWDVLEVESWGYTEPPKKKG